jgi:hypothetical protein
VGKLASKPMIADGGKRAELLVQINSDVEIDREATFRIGSTAYWGTGLSMWFLPRSRAVRSMNRGTGRTVPGTTGIGELAEELKPVIDRMETIIAELDDQDVAGQILESVAKMNSVLEKVDAIMGEAAEGKGAFHTLMKDPTVADDLKTTIREFRLLSQNLRQKGILFYSDLSKKKESGEAQEMSPLIRDRLK